MVRFKIQVLRELGVQLAGNVASDEAAIIIEKVLPTPLSKQMHFITQDICEQPLPASIQSIFDQCQLIYLAAYVGMNEIEKLRLLKNLARKSTDGGDAPGKRYLKILTANEIYQTLFPRIGPEEIAGLQAAPSHRKSPECLEQVGLFTEQCSVFSLRLLEDTSQESERHT